MTADQLLRRRQELAKRYDAADSGCWEWRAPLNASGYGVCAEQHGHKLAHRAVYLAHGHTIPDGYHLHHRCENKRCVNPDHLEPLAPGEHRRLHSQADSTLDWDDVREIRAAWKDGSTMDSLAAAFRLSLGTIHPLILNKTWVDPEYTPNVNAVCVECGEGFTKKRTHQRFCCPKHRDLWNGRRSSAAYTARQKEARRAA